MLSTSVLNTSQCLHVITAADRVPIGQDLCGPTECIMEEIFRCEGGRVVKASHRDCDNCEKMHVLSPQEIKGDKEEQ